MEEEEEKPQRKKGRPKLWESDEIVRRPKMKRRNLNPRGFQIIGMARRELKRKVRFSLFRRANYMDAITAYPILQLYARQNNIPYKKLTLFILINHFEWFQLKDASSLGFNYKFVSKEVRKLVDEGLMERFIGFRNSYSVTPKGKELFNNMHKFYYTRMKVLYEEWEAKRKNKKDLLEIGKKELFVKTKKRKKKDG